MPEHAQGVAGDENEHVWRREWNDEHADQRHVKHEIEGDYAAIERRVAASRERLSGERGLVGACGRD
jgi:hypothetical protein